MSIRSFSSSGSGGSEGSSTFGSVNSNLVSSRLKTAEEGTVGILSAIIDNGKTGGKVYAHFQLIFDFLCGLGFLFASHFPWGSATELSLVTSAIQFRIETYIKSYGDFQIFFWVVVSAIIIVCSSTFLVSKMVSSGKFRRRPVRILRFFISALLRLLLVPMLNILLIPMSCTIAGGTVDAFTSVQCFSVLNIVHAIFGFLSIVVLIFFSAIVAAVYFDPNPRSQAPLDEPFNQPHSSLDMIFLVSRLGLVFANRMLKHYTSVAAIITLICNVAVFGALIYFVPHFSLLTNRIKGMLNGILVWGNILLLIVAKKDDASSPVMLITFAIGVPIFGALAFYVPVLRLSAVDGRKLKLNSNRLNSNTPSLSHLEAGVAASSPQAPPPAKKKDSNSSLPGALRPSTVEGTSLSSQITLGKKVKFHSDIEVELATRFLQLPGEDTEYNKSLVKSIFDAGVRQFPNSAFLMLAFAAFLQHTMEDPDAARGLVERASSLKPSFVFRFIISRQRKQLTQHSDDSAEMDMLNSADFRKNYRAARRFHRLCVSSIQELWRTLLPDTVNLKMLPTLLEYLLKSEARSHVHFQYLEKKYRSPRVLRSYSAFIADCSNNELLAARLLHQAEELEAHLSRRDRNKKDDIDDNNKFDDLNPPDALLGLDPAAAAAVSSFSAAAPQLQNKITKFELEVSPEGTILSCSLPTGMELGIDSLRCRGLAFASTVLTAKSQEVFAASLHAAQQPIDAAETSPRVAAASLVRKNSNGNDSNAADFSDDDDEDVGQDILFEPYVQDVKCKSEQGKRVESYPISRGYFLVKKCNAVVPYHYALFMKKPGSQLALELIPAETTDHPGSCLLNADQSIIFADDKFCDLIDVEKSSLIGLEGNFLLPQKEVLREAISRSSSFLLAAAKSPRPSPDAGDMSSPLVRKNSSLFPTTQFMSFDESVKLGRYIVSFAVEDDVLNVVIDASHAGPGIISLAMRKLSCPDKHAIRNDAPDIAAGGDKMAAMVPAVPKRPGSVVSFSENTRFKKPASVSSKGSSKRSGGQSRRNRERAMEAAVLLDDSSQQKSTVQILHRNILIAIFAVIVFIFGSFITSSMLASRTGSLLQAVAASGTLASDANRLANRCRTVEYAMLQQDTAALNANLPILASRTSTFLENFLHIYYLEEQKGYAPLHNLYYQPSLAITEKNVIGELVTNEYNLWVLGRLFSYQATIIHSGNFTDLGAASNLASLQLAFYFVASAGPWDIKDAMIVLMSTYKDFADTFINQLKIIQSSVQASTIVVLFALILVVRYSLGLVHADRITSINCLLQVPKSVVAEILTRSYIIIEEEKLEEEAEEEAGELPEADKIEEEERKKQNKVQEKEKKERDRQGRQDKALKTATAMPALTKAASFLRNLSVGNLKLVQAPASPSVGRGLSSKSVEIAISATPSSFEVAESDGIPRVESKTMMIDLAEAEEAAEKEKAREMAQDQQLERNGKKGLRFEEPQKSKSFLQRLFTSAQEETEAGKEKTVVGGGVKMQRIDAALSKTMESRVVSGFSKKYISCICAVGVLLLVALSLGITALTQIGVSTDDIIKANQRLELVDMVRYLAREILNAGSPADRNNSRQQMEEHVAKANQINAELLYGTASDMADMGGSALRYRPMEDWMFSQPLCHRLSSADCPSPTDPLYNRLTASLATLYTDYMSIASQFAQLPDSALSVTNEYYTFLFDYPYDNVRDGERIAADLTVQESMDSLQQSKSDQMAILMSALGVVLFLYFFIFRSMIAYIGLENKRTASVLMMIPGDTVEEIEEIRVFVSRKQAELSNNIDSY